MAVATYAIGVDFGTEACRAIVVDLSDGNEVGVVSLAYPHGVVDDLFPEDGSKLPRDWAIQYPSDYLTVLEHCVQGVLVQAEIDPASVISLGLDATACTLIPVDAHDTALADLAPYASNPHAYAKLWKDHSSQPQASRINAAALERGEKFVDYYGGKISSEWVLAKTLKLAEEAPEIFAAAERIYECGDWLVSTLVGEETRSAAVAGYKASYQAEIGGYPTADFLEGLFPGFADVLGKLGWDFLVPGQRAGGLTAQWAQRLGLPPGIAVGASNMDAQVAMLGAGISKPGEMLLVMGTSVCNLMLADEREFVPGVAGLVSDGIVPGYWAYETGQAGVGDTFGWYVRNMVPAEYVERANAESKSVYELLEEMAARMQPGESGVMALDWFNGNRATLMDSHLSGLLVGMTLQTKPEHIYRALIEGSAFGQRIIVEAFRDAGVPVTRLVACGGLASRAPLLIQTLADVLGMEIEVSRSEQTPALGAALHGALAAGSAEGGFAYFGDASRIASPIAVTYAPNKSRVKQFDELFALYRRLYEQFGNEERAMMHSLRAHASQVSNNKTKE